MTREINGRIRMVVSDDGTRCAAECPRWSETPPDGYGAYHKGEWCDEFGALYDSRARECIAAEQAAASVPSCEGARGLDASEALREARAQGMRDGLSIAKGNAYATFYNTVDWSHVDEVFHAAIEAVRKGER